MRILAAIPFLALAVSVSGHAIFQEVYVNGVSQGHTTGIRVPNYNGPIENVNSNDIICNGGINPYRQPVSQMVITVPAGAQVTTRWRHTLEGGHVIDSSHKGPIITYLAKVDDATSLSVTGLRWFKIQEEGYNPSTGKWAVDNLIANDGKYSFAIPSCIQPGEYLMRHELIALHAAGNYPGAQFYMECAQIRITGGGSASPATVAFPGAYSGSDPGVHINIYGSLSNYIIPGPPVFSCNGQQPPTQPTVQPTTQPPVTTQPPSGGGGSGAAQWAQCGGSGFSGPTTCQSPYTCVKVNDWYSQCQ